METKKSLTYLRAKKKVEMLKGFYSHLAVYIIVNVVIILVSFCRLGELCNRLFLGLWYCFPRALCFLCDECGKQFFKTLGREENQTIFGRRPLEIEIEIEIEN